MRPPSRRSAPPFDPGYDHPRETHPMNATTRPSPGRRGGARQPDPRPQRERRISRRPHGSLRRGDRTAPSHRAGRGQRRALPPGGQVVGDYRFEGEDGQPTSPVVRRQGDPGRLQLHVRARARTPVPNVHQPLDAWEGNAADIGERVSLAVVARSPIESLSRGNANAGGRTSVSSATSTPTIPATISGSCPTGLRFRRTMSSPAATGPSAISGPAK